MGLSAGMKNRLRHRPDDDPGRTVVVHNSQATRLGRAGRIQQDQGYGVPAAVGKLGEINGAIAERLHKVRCRRGCRQKVVSLVIHPS